MPVPSTTRAGKGSALTNAELDANFTDLDANKQTFIVSSTSGSNITPVSTDTQLNVTLTANATINAPSGSPTDGLRMMMRIIDDGTARTITWNAIYRAMAATLPTTTVSNKLMYVGFIYNSTAVKWDAIAYTLEA